ncbi:hypothetical protein AC1031_000327 [Aphanomyces cochlioides]|nr:hypothetical protein AC1031_000327 [Aphanomyces cochlioides]
MLQPNQPKYSTFGADASATHPRPAASLLSKTFFSWCIPLVCEQRQLNVEDVWPLEDYIKAETNTKALSASFQLRRSVFWSGVGGEYLANGLVNLFIRLLDLVGPLVLQKIVESTSDLTPAYYWLGLLLVAKVMRSILWSHLVVHGDTLGIRVLSGFKGIILQKLLSKASNTKSDIADLSNVSQF